VSSEALEALEARLAAEQEAYARALAALDALASFALPAERLPEQPAQMERLNALWALPPLPDVGHLARRHQRAVWGVVAPALQRQQEWNAALVQLLNGQLVEVARLHAHLRELAGALVAYAQRLEPVTDARDRVASALATTRSELVLQAFERRLESLHRKIDGLSALRDRLEVVGEQVRALSAAPVEPAAAQAAADASYVAFENRFRGSGEVRERLSGYLELLRDCAPVVDLGCGRGELLELLRESGVAARGVESNAAAVAECRGRGLEVAHGDLLSYLRGQAQGSLGGVFAAQVVEHLPPDVLQALLAEAHRVLRRGGVLLLETVNVRSLLGFLEVYNRDLSHQRPLHPDTLRFLAAAAGFGEARIELRTPVDAASRLQPIPTDDLPERAAQALNENVERLNGLLYGPLEYALVARR
jgi:O-antigen chain-terminating methyltransferase